MLTKQILSSPIDLLIQWRPWKLHSSCTWCPLTAKTQRWWQWREVEELQPLIYDPAGWCTWKRQRQKEVVTLLFSNSVCNPAEWNNLNNQLSTFISRVLKIIVIAQEKWPSESWATLTRAKLWWPHNWVISKTATLEECSESAVVSTNQETKAVQGRKGS